MTDIEERLDTFGVGHYDALDALLALDPFQGFLHFSLERGQVTAAALFTVTSGIESRS